MRQLLATVKPLAVKYYQLTGKALGVAGEVAEYMAAELLNLQLMPARTVGYDALDGNERIEIKGRACKAKGNPGQKMGRIRRNAPCDAVILVLLDSETLEAREIWKAAYSAVEARLAIPGSKARARGQLAVSEFQKLGRRIWPTARASQF